MSTVADPTRDGYSEEKPILFCVYQLEEGAVVVDRLRGIFDFEGDALALALAISPFGHGVRIVEIIRLPEVHCR